MLTDVAVPGSLQALHQSGRERWPAAVRGAHDHGGGALLGGAGHRPGDVVNALTIFYTLLGVSLFVPILAGLYVEKATTVEAIAAIVCGVAAVVVVQLATDGAGIAGLTPALLGLIAAFAGFGVVYMFRMASHGRARVV
jgi:SSS family solute:Na+ symporter